ncbi:MAG: hypothetical protein K2X82_27165 [Gemmataceae bacterium]|nr:hypothetical protein [Gemmataceae bacterium]
MPDQPQPGGPPGGSPAPGGPTPAEAEALEAELEAFQKKVTLGDWPGVKAYLAGLPDEEATAGYRQLLRSLQQMPNPNAGVAPPPGMSDQDLMLLQMRSQGPAQQFAERHAFTADDLFGLAAAAPAAPHPDRFPPRLATVGGPMAAVTAPPGLDKENLNALTNIVRETINGGTLTEVLVARLKADAAKPAGEGVFTHRQVAKLLTLAGQAEFAGDFLPTFDEAVKTADLEALNLLARHFVVLHAKESGKGGNLERAWGAVQAVLVNPIGDPDEKEEALLRAVELAPRLKDAYGQEWLDASFTKNPDRGMEILASVGTLVSRGLSTRPFDTDGRLNALKLSKTAVEALLKAAPDRAAAWRPTLTLLALGWLKEAEFSQRFDTSSQSRLRRDRYGNMYMFDDDDFGMQQRMMQQRPDMPRPVTVADVIKAGPSPAWVKAIDPSLKPRLAGTAARLHLKSDEDEKAFPLIEELAPAQPAEAKELVKEFLQVWTRNHDPNANRNRYRYSWFFFAFEQRAESIPLTRSKQERNLQELARWAKRIKALPAGAGDIDDQIVVRAFTACHSSAEVYKTEAIETVFGKMKELKPRTVAGLAEQMRSNLAGQWKDPNEQQQKKTNRKKKDIEQEVLRGYVVARGVVADGLKNFPGHWALLAAAAGLLHDEANFRQEMAKSSEFAGRRAEAFALYQAAAADYAKAVRTLPEDEQTTSVHEQWFAACLGAVDLGLITEDQQPDWKQPPLIKAALAGLPGDLAEKHLEKFANNLFVKMSGTKPHVKFNYLKAGFQVVGEANKNAAEAKKVFDYYKDLVTEIKLDAVLDLDRSSRVGHGRPVGLFVNLRHTRDIERESGGFGRYLQNQNALFFSYNYGRPTADYRQRFEDAAKAALKEQFEVLSVSFQDEKVHSRATQEFGWRYTPYAYILLKPRGPQVDKIPPLRLDLDFLDTSGYVVMPVETPAVPIDAKDPMGDARPVDKLVVTQTLDERQADKGVLILEVKAVGQGLVPDLKELCDPAFDGFEVTKTEDPPVGVKKFEEDADRNLIVSERVWTLTLKAKEGLGALPTVFRFPAVKVPTKETVFQRYADADLTTVGQEVSLEKTYGTASTRWVWVAAAGAVLGLFFLGGLVWLLTRKAAPVLGPGLPEDPDPFVTAAILRDVRDRRELSPAQRAAVDQDLAAVEQFFFAADRNGAPAPDLGGLVRKWAAAVPAYRPAAVAAG